MNHFSKSTLNKLAKAGITLVGLQAIPDFPGDVYLSGTGYVLNDNGTHCVRRWAEVMALAKAGA